ncbi:Down syndrome cell adhesion molecule-like protein Dscam2 [Nymphon striatum]|nr:Down syndrome cell adhesion molecule-like protein Dscam2 [Nymphon striatum]
MLANYYDFDWVDRAVDREDWRSRQEAFAQQWAKICTANRTLSGPVFILEPNSNVEFLNTKGTRLDCSAHGSPDPEVQWLRQEGHTQMEVVDVPSLVKVYNNGSVQLMMFTADQYRQNIHATVYRCMAQNKHGVIISPPVSVRAGTIQRLQAKVYDEYVIRGNTAVFKCHIPAFQRRNLIVTGWIREDNYIIRSSEPRGSRYIMTLNGNLHIRYVKYSDQLMSYWCQVSNRLTGETFLSQTSGRVHLNEPQGSVPPKITDTIQEVSVMKGESVQLPCAAQGHPSPSYRWKFKGTVIKKSESRGSLLISETHQPSTDTYICEVSNNIGADKAKTILTIREHLQAHIEPQQQVINTGQGIKLSCIVTGFPVNEVEWNFNGKPIAFDERISLTSKHELVLNEARREDRGMYQCFVSNKWQTVQGTAQLLLGRLKPSFIKTFESVVIQPGPSVDLICTATGIPRVAITWSVNGRPLITTYNKVIIKESEIDSVEDTITSTLTIMNVKVEDGGLYSCIAINEVGNVTHENGVHVYGRPIVHQLSNISAVSGESVRIQCYVSGYPIKSITWRRAGKTFYMPVGSKSFKNGTLIMKNVNKADAGVYECIAKNEGGQEASASAIVTIIAKPEISPMPPPGKLSEGSHFTTICNVIYGDEPVEIKWLKNGRAMTADDGVELTKTKMYVVLQIRKLKGTHNGNYTCMAENLAGKTIRNVTVRIRQYGKNNLSTLQQLYLQPYGLDCLAKGYPSPFVRWFKIQGNEFIELKTKNRFQIHKNGTLELSDLQKTDQAKFRCIASNGVLPNLVKEVSLQVGAPPTFINKIFVVLAMKSENIRLKCKVAGDSPMQITWYKNSKKLESHHDHIIRQKSDIMTMTESLVIMKNVEMSSSGTYICFGPQYGDNPNTINDGSDDLSENDTINEIIAHPVLKEITYSSETQTLPANPALMSVIEEETEAADYPSKCYSLDRGYGRLKATAKESCSNGGTIYANYEIPDYYAGLKPYATLHVDTRKQKLGELVMLIKIPTPNVNAQYLASIIKKQKSYSFTVSGEKFDPFSYYAFVHRQRRDSASNKLLDTIFAHITKDLEKDDPYNLPEERAAFHKKEFFVTIDGEAKVFNGKLHGLSTMYHFGDSKVIHPEDKKTLSIESHVGLKNLDIEYSGKASLGPVSLGITVDAGIETIKAKLIATQPATGTGNLQLTEFKVEDLEGFSFGIKDALVHRQRRDAQSDKLLDTILEHLRKELKKDDPYNLPEERAAFHKKEFFVTISGEAKVFNGKLHGLSTIYHFGDSKIVHPEDKKTLSIETHVGLKDLNIEYSGKASLGPVSLGITVDAGIATIKVKLIATQPATGTGKLQLTEFKVEDLEGIAVRIAGLGALTPFHKAIAGIFKNKLLAIITNLFHTKIRNLLNKVISNYRLETA